MQATCMNRYFVLQLDSSIVAPALALSSFPLTAFNCEQMSSTQNNQVDLDKYKCRQVYAIVVLKELPSK